MDISLFTLQTHGDERGSLVALEEFENIPFSVKRVYYMFETLANVVRGGHAHKRLRQVVIAVRGSCRFSLDDGSERIELLLDNPKQALLIEPMIYHEMYDFSEDCVLLALANELFDEDDYIRSYEQFKLLVSV